MKQTGYTCDRQACGKFEVSEHLPDGWVVMKPNVATDDVKNSDHHLEFCSNTCLAITAVDRALALDNIDVLPTIRKIRKAEENAGGAGESRRVEVNPVGAPAGVDNGARARHVRWHENRGLTDPSCEFCMDGITASTGARTSQIGDTRDPAS